jgi:hypothetical protein
MGVSSGPVRVQTASTDPVRATQTHCLDEYPRLQLYVYGNQATLIETLDYCKGFLIVTVVNGFVSIPGCRGE